jgi:nucleotide-binding universal stress UspA family protein
VRVPVNIRHVHFVHFLQIFAQSNLARFSLRSQSMKTLVLVVGYDRSDLAKLALAHALAVARGAAQAKVLVTEILSIPAPARGEVLAFSNEQTMVEVHRVGLLSDLKDFPTPEHVSLVPAVRYGEPARELCDIATEEDADFIFMGTHGRKGLEHFVVGSVAERVVQKAPCSVIVVRAKLSDLAPQVEAPCADCSEAKRASGDANMWCQVHTRHTSRPMHLHYKYPEHFARGSMNLRVDE